MAPKFPAKSLVATGGDLYAHIHENELTGLARNLFWCLSIKFAPVEYEDSSLECSMACEWIPWEARDWRSLDQQSLRVKYDADGFPEEEDTIIEASFYTYYHQPAREVFLELAYAHSTVFHVTMKMVVDFRKTQLQISAETDVPYTGLFVVKDNLTPKPTSVAKVLKVAEEFVDVQCYDEPIAVDGGWKWVFSPKKVHTKNG